MSGEWGELEPSCLDEWKPDLDCELCHFWYSGDGEPMLSECERCRRRNRQESDFDPTDYGDQDKSCGEQRRKNKQESEFDPTSYGDEDESCDEQNFSRCRGSSKGKGRGSGKGKGKGGGKAAKVKAVAKTKALAKKKPIKKAKAVIKKSIEQFKELIKRQVSAMPTSS